MTARFELRDATAAAHQRVDAAFADGRWTDRDSYVRFLSMQAAALVPLEEALTDAGAARLIDGWDDHRRAPLLEQDLASLEVALPPRLNPPEIHDDSELAGALYVLEGSRLGGAMLRKRVPGHFPAAFLSAPQSPGRWTRFAMSLDQLLDTPAKLQSAIEAAHAAFARFETAAEPAA